MIDLQEINSLISSYELSKKTAFNRMFSIENFEEKSKKILNNIDDDELNDYFLKLISVINDCKVSLVEKYYYSNVSYIFNNHFEAEVDEAIYLFKKKISDNYRSDNSFYKRSNLRAIELGINDSKDICKYIVQEAYSQFSLFHKSIDKLKFIYNQQAEIEKFIIADELFNNFDNYEIFNPSEFELMFVERKKFHEIIELLQKNNIICKNKGKYYWQGVTIYNKLESKKLLCTLCYVLSVRNYFIKTSDTDIVKTTNSFIENETITNTIYGRYRKEYSVLTKRQESDYFRFFHFIP